MAWKAERSRVKNITTEKLSPGERLLIWRKRLNWNQYAAAKSHGVSIFTYKLAEYDKLVGEKFAYPNDQLTLKDHEKCLLYRRRAGKKQHQIAKALDISRNWLVQQESGKIRCTQLLRYWEGGG